jgi:toxin ParE1/3/4
MAEYRLTDRARADLIDIYDFTENRFGAYQADAYYAGLIRTFGLLADFPRIGQGVDELAAGYRRFRFQSHLIFYTGQPEISKSVPSFTAPRTSGPNFSIRC